MPFLFTIPRFRILGSSPERPLYPSDPSPGVFISPMYRIESYTDDKIPILLIINTLRNILHHLYILLRMEAVACGRLLGRRCPVVCLVSRRLRQDRVRCMMSPHVVILRGVIVSQTSPGVTKPNPPGSEIQDIGKLVGYLTCRGRMDNSPGRPFFAGVVNK